MSEIAIEVKDLSVRYKNVRAYSIKKNLLRDGVAGSKTFEAVKGISFSLEKGEILGIVGKNGSGKSTLLRAVAGIFTPDTGEVDLHGNSVALLAIGVGFQKELTGRENIILSGMLMGFSKKEVLERMDKIIEFSELGDFIDAPVRTYSSGMHSKLAFSITAVLETDILLVDEVLSVGDARFKKKSYKKMKELISDKNRTVVIVSHDKKTVSDLCTKVLWIDSGEIIQYGDTQPVLAAYEEYMK